MHFQTGLYFFDKADWLRKNLVKLAWWRRQNISILCNQNTTYVGFAAFLFARVEIRPPGLTPVLPAVLRINIKC